MITTRFPSLWRWCCNHNVSALLPLRVPLALTFLIYIMHWSPCIAHMKPCLSPCFLDLVVILKHSQDFAQKLNLKVQSLHRPLWYIQSQLFIFPFAALWDCANTEGETGFQFSKSCLGIWPCGRGSWASRCSFARSSGSLPAFQWEENFSLKWLHCLEIIYFRIWSSCYH